MRVFKTNWFARFVRQEGLTDDKLMAAIREVEMVSMTAIWALD